MNLYLSLVFAYVIEEVSCCPSLEHISVDTDFLLAVNLIIQSLMSSGNFDLNALYKF
jgi:hypothetical protein